MARPITLRLSATAAAIVERGARAFANHSSR